MSLRWVVVGALLMAGAAFDSAQASVNWEARTEPQIPKPELRQEWVAQGASTEGDAAKQLFDEGFALFQEGSAASLRAAIDNFEAAIPLYQAANNRFGEALTQLAKGLALDRLDFKPEALAAYEIALTIWQELSPQVTGDNLQTLQKWEATTLNNIGSVYDNLGDKQKALDYYNQALSLRRTIGDGGEEATILHNIGLVYNSLGEQQQALNYYNQALNLRRAVGDLGGEAVTLTGIGLVYNSLGEQQKALDYYNQALPLRRAVGDRRGEAGTLNNIGGVYSELGEQQKALGYYNQALLLRRTVGDRSGEATTLTNLGAAYSFLGEKQQALDYYNQALSLYREVGDRGGEAVTLNNMGLLYSDLGEKQQALDYYNQALPLLRAVGDRNREAIALNNIGGIYRDWGERQTALDYYNQALPLYQAVGDRGGEATSLNNIGLIYSERGEISEASDYYNQALPLYKAVGDRDGEANTLRNLAWMQRGQGQLTAALPNIEGAIALLEQLRAATPPGELRQTYFASVQNYYQFYLDLLMELHEQNPNQGYDAQAFQASESSRARILIEQLTEANIDIRQGVNPTLVRQEQDLIQKLNTAEQQRISLVNSGTASDNQIAQQIATIDNILDEVSTVESRIRQNSPAYAQLKFPEPLNLKQVQNQVLDEETLLLEYALGEEKSYLFLVSKTGLTTYTLPPKPQIEAAVEAYREQLQTPTFKDLSQGQELSEMLLGQVTNQLSNKRLVIVSNGKLQLLPFGALPVPKNSVGAIPPWLPRLATKTGVGAGALPLLANHEIIALPSATSLAIQRQQWQNRPQATKAIALFADPVFNAQDDRFAANVKPDAPLSQNLADLVSFDERTGCSLFSRLPYTAIEAENILNLVPDDQTFQAIGFAADYEAATNEQLQNYQVLHIATHGCIQDDARLSGLALSAYEPDGDATPNQLLKLQDIYNLELNAELVVLSACQTGVGTDIAGEGVVGLTSGFLYAGAKRVVVSLWNVSDRGTADLMTNYYQQMLVNEVNPTAALRQAQLATWESGTKYSAPYYWAAFTLQGEF